jgi:hypothetical protein
MPLSVPVLLLNVAQAGLFAMLKRNQLLFASLAEGVKAYAEPAATAVMGVPEIVGGVLLRYLHGPAWVTVGSAAQTHTSNMTIFLNFIASPSPRNAGLRARPGVQKSDVDVWHRA